MPRTHRIYAVCALGLYFFGGCTLPDVFVDKRDAGQKAADGAKSAQAGKSSATEAATSSGTDDERKRKPDASQKPSDNTSADDADGGMWFVDDPAPPMCGRDGKMVAAPDAGANGMCPADRNREGCSCSNVGQELECWPGSRVNRNHGICHDGKTVCQMADAGRKVWGPCVGYTLPKAGATRGADACRCFSKGQWALSNLVPCIVDSKDGANTYLYSSRATGQGGYSCGSVTDLPPAAPKESWSKSTLTVDCAGQFELCYTLKAGYASNPGATDCVLTRLCFDVWYETAGKAQALPDLPGWATHDVSCAARFKNVGGYGELSVRGISSTCEKVDDGTGDPYVFERTTYCRPDCSERPDAPECQDCSVNGSGSF